MMLKRLKDIYKIKKEHTDEYGNWKWNSGHLPYFFKKQFPSTIDYNYYHKSYYGGDESKANSARERDLLSWYANTKKKIPDIIKYLEENRSIDNRIIDNFKSWFNEIEPPEKTITENYNQKGNIKFPDESWSELLSDRFSPFVIEKYINDVKAVKGYLQNKERTY